MGTAASSGFVRRRARRPPPRVGEQRGRCPPYGQAFCAGSRPRTRERSRGGARSAWEWGRVREGPVSFAPPSWVGVRAAPEPRTSLRPPADSFARSLAVGPPDPSERRPPKRRYGLSSPDARFRRLRLGLRRAFRSPRGAFLLYAARRSGGRGRA